MMVSHQSGTIVEGVCMDVNLLRKKAASLYKRSGCNSLIEPEPDVIPSVLP